MATQYEERILVGVAIICSLSAIIACLITFPAIATEMSDIQAMVDAAVQSFRVDTDLAWDTVMEVKMAFSPSSKSPSQALESIFRPKRRSAIFANLPDYCICEPIEPKCEPGPPGPPGPPGEPGENRVKFILYLVDIIESCQAHYLEARNCFFFFA
ncbi:unnamed protein product [Strongylus vulgaris]|uniref:Nematode cuticle collagen N-terminal domain-containing protein n=1 Tax=Strongylus vulgaris TaxID=40348 RepID=A0A3P7IVX5_STRVU|nr:unnamed protein product [Strongylus vulgaris]